MNKIDVHWEAEDGAGKSRPQKFKIDLSEFDFCESEVEVEEVLDELIQEDFELKVTWFSENYPEIVSAAMNYIAEKKENSNEK